MLRRKGFIRVRIESDEGFSVVPIGWRNTLKYIEGSRWATVRIQRFGADGALVLCDTLRGWISRGEPQPMSDDDRRVVLRNIARSLMELGLVPSFEDTR